MKTITFSEQELKMLVIAIDSHISIIETITKALKDVAQSEISSDNTLLKKYEQETGYYILLREKIRTFIKGD